jgi:hypothetical protein
LRLRSTENLSNPKAPSGLFLRIRGRGVMTLVAPNEGPQQPQRLGEGPPIAVDRDDFGDNVVDLGRTPSSTSALDLSVTEGEVEVDCVIPWSTP